MPWLSGSARRWALACGLVSTWLMLLFVGVVLSGAVHLLLVGAVAIAPWRET